MRFSWLCIAEKRKNARKSCVVNSSHGSVHPVLTSLL